MAGRVEEGLGHEDWFFSFAGNATYPRAEGLRAAALRIPADLTATKGTISASRPIPIPRLAVTKVIDSPAGIITHGGSIMLVISRKKDKSLVNNDDITNIDDLMDLAPRSVFIEGRLHTVPRYA